MDKYESAVRKTEAVGADAPYETGQTYSRLLRAVVLEHEIAYALRKLPSGEQKAAIDKAFKSFRAGKPKLIEKDWINALLYATAREVLSRLM